LNQQRPQGTARFVREVFPNLSVAVLAQAAFAVNSAMWVIILAVRLDRERFGGVVLLVVTAVLAAGLCRAALADPLFVGADVQRARARVLTYVCCLGAYAMTVSLAFQQPQISSASFWGLLTAALLTGVYEVRRVGALASGLGKQALVAELISAPVVLCAAVFFPSDLDERWLAAAMLAAMATGGLLVLRRSSPLGATNATKRAIAVYSLDFLLAGGIFPVFLVVASAVWGLELVGFLRIGQAISGPITTMSLGIWFGLQQLVRDGGGALGFRRAIAAQAFVFAGACVWVAIVALSTFTPLERFLGDPTVTLWFASAKAVEVLSLLPAVAIRHSPRPGNALAARALLGMLLLVAVPTLASGWAGPAVAGGVLVAYAVSLAPWYLLARASARASATRPGSA